MYESGRVALWHHAGLAQAPSDHDARRPKKKFAALSAVNEGVLSLTRTGCHFVSLPRSCHKIKAVTRGLPHTLRAHRLKLHNKQTPSS